MVQNLNKNLVLCVRGFGEDNLLIHIDDRTLEDYSKNNSEPLVMTFTINNSKITYTLTQQQIIYGKPVFFVESIVTEPITVTKKTPMWNSLEAVVSC